VVAGDGGSGAAVSLPSAVVELLAAGVSDSIVASSPLQPETRRTRATKETVTARRA
jgi:hypothetical protein